MKEKIKIKIEYTTQKGNISSNLIIKYNDNGERIGLAFFGKEADVMLKVLQNDTSVLKTFYIDKEEQL